MFLEGESAFLYFLTFSVLKLFCFRYLFHLLFVFPLTVSTHWVELICFVVGLRATDLTTYNSFDFSWYFFSFNCLYSSDTNFFNSSIYYFLSLGLIFRFDKVDFNSHFFEAGNTKG